MNKMGFILKISIIMAITLFTASCSNKVPAKPPIKTPVKAQTQTSEKAPTKILPTSSKQESWENYLNKIVRNRETGLLYTQKDSKINLDEYLKHGRISIDGDSSKIDALKSINVASYLIDLDKDGINELCLIQCEGSIRHYYVEIFKKKNGVYLDESITDGYIFPVRYNNEVHFISIEYDFRTKFLNAIVEYEYKGKTFIKKEILDINYTYTVSGLPKSITKIIDGKYLSELNNYKISNSDIAKIKESSGAPSYDIELVDKKNNNIIRFSMKLWETTVGYAPNEWELETKEDSKFKGIEKIVTHRDKGTDEAVCFGFRFYKDESDNIFLLKVSYPFFTTEERKDGNLLLQLYKFNKNSVVEVEKQLIQPDIQVKRTIFY